MSDTIDTEITGLQEAGRQEDQVPAGAAGAGQAPRLGLSRTAK